MNFEYVKPDDPFIADRVGACLEPDARCQHDHPVTFLGIYGHRRTQPDQTEERLDVVMTRCALASLAGLVTAQIAHDEGEAAADAFRDQIDAYARRYTAPVREMSAAGRLCCQAGYRTGGTEHTCGRTADTA
ncbi:hypothetical protein [Streptomyces antibioticus]|uniref:hypothetical protein n=1 Tax=Streptomyces antibioticus TaxID=1890 RepID=UPI0036AD3BC2